MDISNLGDVIRWPIELIGSILTFIIKYFLVILIIIGTIWIIYWLFSSGVINRISESINESMERKRLIKKLQSLK